MIGVLPGLASISPSSALANSSSESDMAAYVTEAPATEAVYFYF